MVDVDLRLTPSAEDFLVKILQRSEDATAGMTKFKKSLWKLSILAFPFVKDVPELSDQEKKAIQYHLGAVFIEDIPDGQLVVFWWRIKSSFNAKVEYQGKMLLDDWEAHGMHKINHKGLKKVLLRQLGFDKWRDELLTQTMCWRVPRYLWTEMEEFAKNA